MPAVIVAVAAHERAAAIVAAAARLARDTGSPLEVVHVQLTAVVEEQASDTETHDEARAAVTGHLDRLAGQGVMATGQILTTVGDHTAAGRVLALHATDTGARAIAVGRSPHGPLTQFAEGSFTTALTHAATCTVVLVAPDTAPRPLTSATLPPCATARPDRHVVGATRRGGPEDGRARQARMPSERRPESEGSMRMCVSPADLGRRGRYEHPSAERGGRRHGAEP